LHLIALQDFQKVPVAIGNNQFIEFELVINDGTDESNMKLIALKNIFSKQLPKMPKEYIVRLVFDKRHISLAIKRNQRIIGGICYRAYGPQRFAEIAFCAVNSSEQVKGFGTKLMNQLKFVAQRTGFVFSFCLYSLILFVLLGIEYFLTYADNFAIGYFQKQGFSKHISMPKERWVGFIKDYDGGTLMECYVHPGVNYLDISSLVAKQKRFIMDRVKENSL
jgi:histone acetyltransferase